MGAALLRKCGGCRSFFLAEKPGLIRRSIRTGVWWDINECKVPKGCDPSSIAGNITEALAKLSYAAPVSFSAYGNTYLIPLNVQHALLDSGVTLIHTPHGRSDNKYSSSMFIHRDLLDWVCDDHQREPANCLIISGDGGRLDHFNLLRPLGVDLLFATPRRIVGLEIQMKSISKALWRWTSLRAGGPPQWTDCRH